jgi:hypothetical protein
LTRLDPGLLYSLKNEELINLEGKEPETLGGVCSKEVTMALWMNDTFIYSCDKTWAYNSQRGNISKIADLEALSGMVLQNEVYFVLNTSNASMLQYSLCKTNGTPEGINSEMLRVTFQGTSSVDTYNEPIKELTVMGDKLYFAQGYL